ncbi:MAG: flagellar motor switch phosphatase FliY [Tepidanaerobacteraceae bacterium]|nr:flagellar motor switch phosphatase FliY [Thermoanaerobacterales bacterium]
MDEQLLSQEEIEELTRGIEDNNQITKDEIDALGEIGNISIGTSATTLYSLLRNKVVITTPKVSITNIAKLKEAYPMPFISVEVSYTFGLHGSNLMIIKEEDAIIIADLMMGGDGTNVGIELDELRMSAVEEAMNQMMGSAATSLSTMLKKEINISPPKLNRINLRSDTLKGHFDDNEDIVKISFTMEVGNLLKSEIMQLMPIPFAKNLVQQLYNLNSPDEVLPEDVKEEMVDEFSTDNVQRDEIIQNKQKQEPLTPARPKITVNPVEFEVFEQEPETVQSSSIDLILDVSLEVTVELGRTEKTIKEILELSHGTIIELDKIAGEPVDILVNGKLVAKGEVVVVDENFGVRITEIINSIERVKSLQ